MFLLINPQIDLWLPTTRFQSLKSGLANLMHDKRDLLTVECVLSSVACSRMKLMDVNDRLAQ